MTEHSYRGRFAPSPSGDLHLGSLAAALVSYCQAKANNGCWVVRIEDIDETRTVQGAADQIIKTLAHYGMYSDEPIIHQTDAGRQQAYTQGLAALSKQGLTYPCTCTRKQLKGHSVYPGICRDAHKNTNQPHSIRVKTRPANYEFNDVFQGHQSQNISQQSGDFNIRRKDGLFCYQLAVVLDDAHQKITEVVRGIDILDSTSRQMHLIQALGLAQPDYAHFPVINHPNGDKLSKQNHATAITHEDPYAVTWHALNLLKQNPPLLKQKTQSALLNWAVDNWRASPLKHLSAITNQ